MRRVFIALFVLALATATAQAALITISNANFETPTVAAGGNDQTVTGWDEGTLDQNEYVTNADGYWAPSGATQVGYFASTANGIWQSLDYNWSSTDEYTLSFDAYETGWRAGGSDGDSINIVIGQVGGPIIWDSGSIALDGTLVNNGGGEGDISWGSTDRHHTFNFTANDFTAGTEGGQLSIGIRSEGSPAYFDNVELQVIPEPVSLGMLGVFGAILLLRRKLRR